MQTTHVVFGDSVEGSMNAWGWPDPVVALTDDLGAGPLGDLFSDRTHAARLEWWRQVLTPEQLAHLPEAWHRLRTWFRSDQPDDAVVLWVAENPMEMSGYLSVLAHVPATTPVSVINVTQAYARVFNTAEVCYFIKRTGEIAADKLEALIGHAIPLSQSARDDAVARWHGLVASGGHLRHLVDGHVATVGVDYWDPFIVDQAQRLLQGQPSLRAVRLVGECLGRHPQLTNDALIFWRIRCLIEAGTFTYTGSVDSMRDCSIRLLSELL